MDTGNIVGIIILVLVFGPIITKLVIDKKNGKQCSGCHGITKVKKQKHKQHGCGGSCGCAHDDDEDDYTCGGCGCGCSCGDDQDAF